MPIKAGLLDVADGLEKDQVSVGSHDKLDSLDQPEPIGKALLDGPNTQVLAAIGRDGRPNRTRMWLDDRPTRWT